MDDSWSAVIPYVSKASIPYPVLLGDNSLTPAFGKLNNLPVAYFIDRHQQIAAIQIGAGNKKQFEQKIQELLNQ